MTESFFLQPTTNENTGLYKMPLSFSSRSASYTFVGNRIKQPDPGTYDATAFTPPSHHIVKVTIQADLIYTIYLNGARVSDGHCNAMSTKEALRVANEWYKPLDAATSPAKL